MAPGLRVGFMKVPDSLLDTIVAVSRMTDWMTAPLMAEIVNRWILDGVADQLVAWHKTQAERRQKIAHRVFAEQKFTTHPRAYHLWLHLPRDWRTDLFVQKVLRRGVKVFASDVFAVRRESCPNAVRICVGSVKDEKTLERGLTIISNALLSPPHPYMSFM